MGTSGGRTIGTGESLCPPAKSRSGAASVVSGGDGRLRGISMVLRGGAPRLDEVRGEDAVKDEGLPAAAMLGGRIPIVE